MAVATVGSGSMARASRTMSAAAGGIVARVQAVRARMAIVRLRMVRLRRPVLMRPSFGGMVVQLADDQVEEVVVRWSVEADVGGGSGGEVVEGEEFVGECEDVVDVIGDGLPEVSLAGHSCSSLPAGLIRDS